MADLTDYRRKRDFKRTREPAPSRRPHRSRRPIFVVQLHHARTRHYDFRLEVDGVLKSWAVPKGPSMDPAVKRLAVEVEDHPLDYATFAGDIPEGNYGAGHVDIFDHGVWSSDDDPRAQLKKGHLAFELSGGKLRGGWHLIRTARKKRQPEWLLVKGRDNYAAKTEADDLVESPAAVKKAPGKRQRQPVTATTPAKPRARAQRSRRGDRTLTDIADAARQLPGAAEAKLSPGFFQPELARLVQAPPEGEEWLHEAKWDGYRMLCTITDGRPTLWSRNAIEWTQRLPEIVEALAGLGLDAARLDGELIAVKDGISDFNALQGGLSGEARVPLFYVLFDIIHLQRWSLADCALVERKEILRRIVEIDATKRLMYSEHHVGDGKRVFDQAAANKLEGIMSKRADSAYRGGRGDDWRKVKRLQSDEFAIVGFTAPKGSRSGFGSLLLAAAEPGGTWRYVGRVGSGFSQTQLEDLARGLASSRREHAGVRVETIDPLLRGAHWVEPLRVAEVYYRGIGGLGLLRQPSLKAIRADKTAADLAAEAGGTRSKEPIMATKKSKSPRRSRILQAASAPIKVARRKSSENIFGAVALTHPERVVFPADGITKLDVAEYYRQVMPRLLAGVKGRPLSVIRCPAGISGQCFFQKHLTSGLKHVSSVALEEESGSTGDYVYVDDADGVFELVQFNALEFHPWGATAADAEHAQYLVFDLDPAPAIAWARVVAAAIDVRDLLAKAGLKSFVRTTGGKGLHVVVPLRPAASWDRAKKFAHALAESFAAVRPGEFVAVASKQRRDGKIFVDYLRNTRGATSVASYSLRARPGAPAAVPLRWSELKTLKSGDAFNIRNVPARLKRMRGDPWAGYDLVRQDLDSIGELPGK